MSSFYGLFLKSICSFIYGKRLRKYLHALPARHSSFPTTSKADLFFLTIYVTCVTLIA